jgi:hypothetical protein
MSQVATHKPRNSNGVQIKAEVNGTQRAGIERIDADLFGFDPRYQLLQGFGEG